MVRCRIRAVQRGLGSTSAPSSSLAPSLSWTSSSAHSVGKKTESRAVPPVLRDFPSSPPFPEKTVAASSSAFCHLLQPPQRQSDQIKSFEIQFKSKYAATQRAVLLSVELWHSSKNTLFTWVLTEPLLSSLSEFYRSRNIFISDLVTPSCVAFSSRRWRLSFYFSLQLFALVS